MPERWRLFIKISFVESIISLSYTYYLYLPRPGNLNCKTQGKGRKSSRLVQIDEPAATAELVDLLSTWSFASTTRQIFRRFRLAILQSHTCILQEDWTGRIDSIKRTGQTDDCVIVN